MTKEMSAADIMDSLYRVEGFRLHALLSPDNTEVQWRILYKDKLIAEGSTPTSLISGKSD